MRLAAAMVLLALSSLAFGQAEEVAHPDAKVETRLKDLAEELRCLVCQNQTIADSNAPLALDLRMQIRTQIAEGRSDSQIREYMVERYGDFVLYRPPFKASTAILWAGPFALLLFGAGIAIAIMRRRGRARPVPREDSATRTEVASLLETRDPASRD
ncbi:MAG TPA: cytochrome c-type biogenesis protein [Usitatibacter sp.]